MIDNTIIEAIGLVWNNKFDEAEIKLSSKISNNPRYCLHSAEAIFLRSFITADINDTESALKRLKETREMAENNIKILESNKTPPFYQELKSKEEFKNHLLDCKIVLGDSLYMLAVLQLTRDQKFKGCLNLRKSWKMFEESLKQVRDGEGTIKYDNDLLECLHFGAGFFYFAMSIIPAKFLKLVEFVGFKADGQLGLQYIRECSNKGGIRSPFATMVLLFNNLLMPRGLYNPTKLLKEAEVLIEENMARYPQGSLFQVMASHCYRKQCRIELGLQCMEQAIANCAAFPKPPLIYSYELANCHCMRMEWHRAIEVFEKLVIEENFQIRALCGLQLAGCYVMTGQTDKAKDAFAKIKSYVKKSSSVDPIIENQSARYIVNNGHFSAFEVMYIRRDMAKMERTIAERVLEELNKCSVRAGVDKPLACQATAQASASSFFSRFKKRDHANTDIEINDRAAFLLLKGAILKGIDRHDDSMICFQELLDMQSIITEKFYLPYCLYEMSETAFHNKNIEQTIEYLKKCNNISGYDWEDVLKVRLRVTMDQIRKDDGASLPEEEPCLGADNPLPSKCHDNSTTEIEHDVEQLSVQE